MDTLQDLLAREFPDLDRTDSAPTLEALRDWLPTTELARTVDYNRCQLAEAERRHRWGQVRDRLAADQPAGCACLGSGLLAPQHHRGEARYCPACPEGQALQAEAVAAAETQRRQWALQAAGIPRRLAAATFASFPVCEATGSAVAQVRAWALAAAAGADAPPTHA